MSVNDSHKLDSVIKLIWNQRSKKPIQILISLKLQP